MVAPAKTRDNEKLYEVEFKAIDGAWERFLKVKLTAQQAQEVLQEAYIFTTHHYDDFTDNDVLRILRDMASRHEDITNKLKEIWLKKEGIYGR
jgi:hypothetical protein